jgi:hypothetical protein
MATLEEIAAYRPGVLSRLANVLTGGLSGAVTGQAERANEAAYARRALLNEQLQEQQLERAAQRARMNALRASFEEAGGMLGPDAQPDLQTMAMMAQRQRQAAQEAGAQGTLAGLGQQAPAPEDASVLPFYRMGQAKAQAQLGEAKAMRGINQEEQRAIDAALLEQRGIPTAGMTPQQIAARASIERPAATAVAQQEAWAMGTQRQQGAKARAELVARQSRGEIPSPVDVSNLSDLEAIGMLAAIPQQTAGERRTKEQVNALQQWEDLDQTDPSNKGRFKLLFSQLPKSAQEDPENMMLAGIPSKLTTKDRMAIANDIKGFDAAVAFGNRVAQLLDSPRMRTQQAQALWGLPASQIRAGSRRIFTPESQEARLVDAVTSEFEGIVSGARKTLFGASLTGNELESAKAMFANPNSANFLQRALAFIDQKFYENTPQNYQDAGIVLNPATERRFQKAASSWEPLRKRFQDKGLLLPSTRDVLAQPQQPSVQPVAPQQQGQRQRIRFDAQGNRIQ